MNKDNTLGIDFGLSKVGFSIARGEFAEPYSVIRYTTIDELIGKIRGIVEMEQINKIVVGISEGEMAEKTMEFTDQLKNGIGIAIETADETLSTQTAQRLAIDANMSRTKRKEKEDALAATVMLQNYLDGSL